MPTWLINQIHVAVSGAAVPFISHFPIPPLPPAERYFTFQSLPLASEPCPLTSEAAGGGREGRWGGLVILFLFCASCMRRGEGLLSLTHKKSRSLFLSAHNQRKSRGRGLLHARRLVVLARTVRSRDPVQRQRWCVVSQSCRPTPLMEFL